MLYAYDFMLFASFCQHLYSKNTPHFSMRGEQAWGQNSIYAENDILNFLFKAFAILINVLTLYCS